MLTADAGGRRTACAQDCRSLRALLSLHSLARQKAIPRGNDEHFRQQHRNKTAVRERCRWRRDGCSYRGSRMRLQRGLTTTRRSSAVSMRSRSLAPQWQSLDLAKILKYPAAFLSVSQNNSLYLPSGATGRRTAVGTRQPSRDCKGCAGRSRRANLKTFAWIGYEVFRESYPQSEFDAAQYASWIKGKEDWSPEKKKADNDLVAELRALVQPGDLEFNEQALQTAFVGTTLPLDLARKRHQDHHHHRHPSRLVH